MFYAVSENRGLVTEKGKGTDTFLDPLTVLGPFASYEEAQTFYGRKLTSIMGYCGIIEVHASRLNAFLSWVKDAASRYHAGTLPRNDLRAEIKSVTLRFCDPAETTGVHQSIGGKGLRAKVKRRARKTSNRRS